MWSQWPCVSSTRRTPSDVHSSSSCSCSLAASSSTASPVRRQRTTNTLLSTGPTTTLCTSTSGFDQWSVVGAAMAASLSPTTATTDSRRPDRGTDRPADRPVDRTVVVSLSPVTSPEPSPDRAFDQVEVDATLASTLHSLDDAENYRTWIVELASPYLTGPILEVGAGHGTFTEAFAAFGDVTAVEPDPYAAGVGAERYLGDDRVTSVSGVVNDVASDPGVRFGGDDQRARAHRRRSGRAAGDLGSAAAGRSPGDLGAGVPVPLQPVRREAGPRTALHEAANSTAMFAVRDTRWWTPAT